MIKYVKSLKKMRLPSLREIPARFWALLYLVMIPIFALIYFFLPSDNFYHSTVQYEPSLKEDERVILDQVRDVIVTNFRRVHGSDTVEVNGFRINIKEISVTGLRLTSNEIGIKLRIATLKQTPQGEIRSSEPFETSYLAEEGNSVTFPNNTPIFHKILSFKPKELIFYSDE